MGSVLQLMLVLGAALVMACIYEELRGSFYELNGYEKPSSSDGWLLRSSKAWIVVGAPIMGLYSVFGI